MRWQASCLYICCACNCPRAHCGRPKRFWCGSGFFNNKDSNVRYPALACRGQRHGPGPTSYVLFNLPLSLSPELVQPSIVVESRSVSEKSVMYRYLKWVRLESECEEIYCIFRVRQNDLDAAKWSGSSKMIQIRIPAVQPFWNVMQNKLVWLIRRVPVFGRVNNPFCFSSYKKINQLQSNPIAGDHLYQANFFSKVEEVLIYSRTKLWVQKFFVTIIERFLRGH